ncbi:MAG: HAD family phosphatase [Pseudoclavibacter sp.]|nr:HAD family phosphatase [Pseudoclavibacter sp.]
MGPVDRQEARITTLVFDYGGVLTNPLAETAGHFCRRTGLTPQELSAALHAAREADGAPAMAALETARITEEEFVDAMSRFLPKARERLAGRPFGALWFEGRRISEEMLDHVREARRRGLRTALFTNNVVEWRPRWRAQFDVDGLFDLVVDSSEEGVRKPDPAFYRILLERLRTDPEHCLLVDDTAENCEAARALGMQAVEFTSPESMREAWRLVDGANGSAP